MESTIISSKIKHHLFVTYTKLSWSCWTGHQLPGVNTFDEFVEEVTANGVNPQLVKISTDPISDPPTRLKGRDLDLLSHDMKSAHAQRKHRRAYTADSATSARAMKLLEKCKERKASSSYDHGHTRSSKHQQKQEMQAHSSMYDHDSDHYHHHHHQQHIASKSSQHSASCRSSSGARHLMSRHLSDNAALQKVLAADTGYVGDSSKSRGKLLSRFSLE
ncbi:hypothetical protein ElyMa_006706100 [Elysia marginata]|uniref:Uncharacterized protein n=1 Tax=Elysia marginata TaxID=1093978 RepID=A0AAV4IUQ7_9GAST|nr:hypothetical protein ElyMa_006706100 [Elysia marginata]